MMTRTIRSDGMRRVVAIGLFIASAVIALALSGCVTEEIGPTELHTTAYVEGDAPPVSQEQSRTNASPSNTDSSDSSREESHH